MHTSQQLTPRQKSFFSILVYIIIPLGGISTDIYLPSLPAITAHFHVIRAMAQMTVTSYVLALGLAQLVAGPLSDAMGRKKLLAIAMIVQLVSVLAIISSPSIDSMIIFRFFQGLGAAFMMVPARAIMNDMYEGHQLKKKINYITIAFALGPILGPFIGGYLQQYVGWHANFYFILLYICIVIALLLPFYRETIAEKHAFSASHLWGNYSQLLSSKYFSVASLFIGLLWGYIALFNIVGPFLVQTIMHRSAVTYGHLALLMGVAWFLGNTINRLLFHVKKMVKVQISLWVSVVAILVMFFLSSVGSFNLVLLVIPTFFIVLCAGAIFPIYLAEALTLFPEIAASSNACAFAVMWIFFAVFTAVGALLKVHSLLPLAGTYLGIIIICLITYYGAIFRFERQHKL